MSSRKNFFLSDSIVSSTASRSVRSLNNNDNENDKTRRIIQDACNYIVKSGYGIVYIMTGGLEGEPMEYWDPVFLASNPSSEALNRMTNQARDDYVSVEKMLPSTGLLQGLWDLLTLSAQFEKKAATSYTSLSSSAKGNSTSNNIANDDNPSMSIKSIPSSTNRGKAATTYSKRRLYNNLSRRISNRSGIINNNEAENYEEIPTKQVWCHAANIVVDPDIEKPRLNLLKDAGIGIFGAVPYVVNNQVGFVVFGARETVDMEKIQSPSNEALLKSSAMLIGQMLSFRRSYQEALLERSKELTASTQRVRRVLKFLTSINDDPSSSSLGDVNSQKSFRQSNSNTTSLLLLNDNFYGTCITKIKAYFSKFGGSDTIPPPSLPWHTSLFCSIATFCTLLVWGLINQVVHIATDGKRHLHTRGSLGSIVASQYLLFASPASQPWNAFMSEVLCGIIALTLNYITFIPRWLMTALTPAVVIFVLGKTGAVSPTTGADALLYVMTDSDWITFAAILSNYGIAILMATIINNITLNRQYPNYWIPWQNIYGFNKLVRRCFNR